MENNAYHIGVIGLGYVGLGVAVAFSKKYSVTGFDVHPKRVKDLNEGRDTTGEVDALDLKNQNLTMTDNPALIAEANFYIVTVPTPLDNERKPNLSYLMEATKLLATLLKPNDIIVYESTVYPGATEEECIPLLEKISNLKVGKDFGVGYSPERINPADKTRSFTQLNKIIAAIDKKTLEIIKEVYSEVIKADLHSADSIKIAETAKLIENTQRDLNIALMNELAKICNHLEIDTQSVIKAASTKWNFIPFQPGLVGGHCIGAAPHHLSYRAKKAGYRPEVILAGRRINDEMGKYIAQQTIKRLIHNDCRIKDASVTILGLTFKEDCSDLRNSKVADIINELNSFGLKVKVHDPIACEKEALHHYEINLSQWHEIDEQDALILCVPHQYYHQQSIQAFRDKLKPNGLIIDIKGILAPHHFQDNKKALWRL